MIYLGIGSNINPKEQYLEQAFQQLENSFPTSFQKSNFYETAPFGGIAQNSYLNACVCFQSKLSPSVVLKEILEIEKDIGRIRTETKWDSRIIDIDILLYGQEIIHEENLQVPHYDLARRDFFLIPLLELNPSLVNPHNGLSLKEELEQLPKELKTSPQRISL